MSSDESEMNDRELIEQMRDALGPVIGFAEERYEYTGCSSILADEHRKKIDDANAAVAAADARLSNAHTTEDDYRHFLAYSGLNHSATLRYVYYHGADVGLDKPDGPDDDGGLSAPDPPVAATARLAEQPPSAQPAGEAVALAPIERDESYDRTYIPLPGGWEIQTKGKGSTFRLLAPDGFRLPITEQPHLFEQLEKMARDIHAACTADPIEPQTVAGAVPGGFVIVPKEPTETMIRAMEKQWMAGAAVDMARREYAAMLASAPQPPKENT